MTGIILTYMAPQYKHHCWKTLCTFSEPTVDHFPLNESKFFHMLDGWNLSHICTWHINTNTIVKLGSPFIGSDGSSLRYGVMCISHPKHPLFEILSPLIFSTGGNFWKPMATFGNWWQLLVTDGNFWQLMANFCKLWQFWQLVATDDNFMHPMASFWTFWEPLVTDDNFWQLLLLLLLSSFFFSFFFFFSFCRSVPPQFLWY